MFPAANCAEAAIIFILMCLPFFLISGIGVGTRAGAVVCCAILSGAFALPGIGGRSLCRYLSSLIRFRTGSKELSWGEQVDKPAGNKKRIVEKEFHKDAVRKQKKMTETSSLPETEELSVPLRRRTA